MPLPAVIPAAGWAATKLGGLMTAIKGLGAAKTATQLAIPGLDLAAKSTGARMAGQALVNPAFKGGLGKAIFGEMSKGQIAARLAPDAIFGGVAALQTPGDLGDKLIAGTASGLGGALGGIGLSRAANRFGEGASYAADFGGSILGDMGGMAIGDTLQRGKDKLFGGSGQTAYERMSAEQQAQFAAQIRQQTLASAGLVPGVRDQYMYGTGLE